MKTNHTTASVVLAAGRGSRMKGFAGNKTLLPLVPDKSPYSGKHPILVQVLSCLPPGPKAVIVNHKKEDVILATRGNSLTYCEQPELNGTGGALLAAREFLEKEAYNNVIITMGDIPLVNKSTYNRLVDDLKEKGLVVLGFRPEQKKQYGVLVTKGNKVQKIIEWKYWKTYPEEKQQSLQICNSGIYAARKDTLLRYLSVLASRPHKVQKEVDGIPTEVEEYFITDLVEFMYDDGLPVGYVLAGDENEVMGVDDLLSIIKAQELFRFKM